MKTYYFYKSIRRTIIQFLDMFNDINIARYDNAGEITGYHRVPLKYGPKAKVYYWLHEKDDDGTPKNDILLPVIGVSLESIEWDSTRLSNMFDSIRVETDLSTRTISKYLNPMPYNLMFNLNVWANYMVDIDQICEQILPYFAPHAFTRIYIEELNTTVENKILLQSCTPDVSPEFGEEDWREIKWNIGFLVQTYIFKPIGDVGLVEKIFTNLYTDEDAFGDRSTTSLYTSGAGPSAGYAESMYLKGTGYDDDANILYNYEVF